MARVVTARWRYALVGLVGLVGLGLGLVIATAPSIAADCDHLLALARIAGEPTDAATRERCHQRLEQRRRRRGPVAWVRTSWCLRRAATIPDAGACR